MTCERESRRSTSLSDRLFREASEIFPGGVNSPARAFGGVGGTPPFIAAGEGAYLTDVDGNRYVDYVLSFGPHILGHADPAVVRAISDASARGVSFGACTESEIRLAARIRHFMPSMEKLRFVNSGTEAVMSALRVARAYTGREIIVKFEGHYHGHSDPLLARAGSGVATLGLPDSPGVPASAAAQTLVIPFNDIDALHSIIELHGDQIAAVVVEPVAGNMGVVLPRDDYLQQLRALTRSRNILLIFDEVMTAFRVHPGGAQSVYGIDPDLTTLGKVIGGGLPIGAYGGRRDIMALVAPEGAVYQAGTMSGNPVAMAAGSAVLDKLAQDGFWNGIAENTIKLADGLADLAHRHGIAVQVPRAGTMLSLYFSPTPVTDWSTASASRTNQFRAFFHSMLDSGIYLPPSPFESWFLSAAHDDEAISATLNGAEMAFEALAGHQPEYGGQRA